MAKRKAESSFSTELSEVSFLPTGIFSIDLYFKGWPLGYLSLITGFPGSGKTTLALSSAKEALSRGMEVHYFDSEYGLSVDWINKIGIPLEGFHVYQDINLEKAFELLEELVKKKSLIIIDSIAALLPEAEESYGYRARFLSQNLIPILRQAHHTKSSILALNQMRYSFSSPGNYILPGGFALLHYSSTHMELSLLRRIYANEGVQALEITFHLVKIKQGNYSKLPKGSFIINFKEGVNPALDLRRLAESLKIVEVKNNMVYLDDKSWTERGFLEWLKREGKPIMIEKLRKKIYEEVQSETDSEED